MGSRPEAGESDLSWLNWVRGILPGRGFLNSGRFWVPATLTVLVVCGVLCCLFWDRLNSITEIRTEELETGVKTIRTETVESNSTTIRNVGLVVGGIVAVMLAMWRSLVAQRQADATLRQASAVFFQAKTAERQSTTALRNFLNERYEQGSSKLGSDDPTVRMEGIDMLERPAREHPSEYHVQVIKRLSLFVRTSVSSLRLREEVAAAMAAIGSRSKEDVAFEDNETFELNLSGSDLRDAHLARLNLSGSNLMKADLSGAVLRTADLSNARLQGANLKDAWLFEANLSGTQFSLGEGDYPAEGMTQTQLDAAHSYRDILPKLDGVLDAESGEQLNPPTTEPGFWDTMTELAEALKEGQPEPHREES